MISDDHIRKDNDALGYQATLEEDSSYYERNY